MVTLLTMAGCRGSATVPQPMDPDQHHPQVLVTWLLPDGGSRTCAPFRHTGYHYPASTVKLPVAALALETLAPGQPVPAAMADDIRRIFAVSDNAAFNRLLDLVGAAQATATLQARGYTGTAIRHGLGGPVGPRPRPDGTAPLPVGQAHMLGGTLIPEPMDFSQRNHLPLADLHRMVLAINRPDRVPANARFRLDAERHALLVAAMDLLPRTSGFPEYARLPDNHARFLLPADSRRLGRDLLVRGKSGMAYGFTTDSVWVRELASGREWLLSASLYTNANGVLNDDTYEYETVALPWLRSLFANILASGPDDPCPAPQR